MYTRNVAKSLNHNAGEYILRVKTPHAKKSRRQAVLQETLHFELIILR